jgi:hypothetical protein
VTASHSVCNASDGREYSNGPISSNRRPAFSVLMLYGSVENARVSSVNMSCRTAHHYKNHHIRLRVNWHSKGL